MLSQVRASLSLLIILTLITGIAYPLLISFIGQTLLPYQAFGSLLEKNGKIIGSKLIGQNFSSNKYFYSRPSAAGGGYDAGNSSGSNLPPSSLDLIKTVTARVDQIRENGDIRPIPIDLVTTSGSGLDPDISIAAAQFQASRVATARNLPLSLIDTLIAQNTSPRLWGILGENYVNVLTINMALDALPTP